MKALCQKFAAQVLGLNKALCIRPIMLKPSFDKKTELLEHVGADNTVEMEKFFIKFGFHHIDNIKLLHAAVSQNRLAAVQYILEFHPDINIPNTRGMTPLMAACEMADKVSLQLIETLIKAGADVNAKCALRGQTPLFFAATSNNRDARIIKCLLLNGADPTNVDGLQSDILDVMYEGFTSDVIDKVRKILKEIDTNKREKKDLRTKAELGVFNRGTDKELIFKKTPIIFKKGTQ